eukprot:scaffold706_cov418-Prasinococcus_capsulatus_cf.AAC.6
MCWRCTVHLLLGGRSTLGARARALSSGAPSNGRAAALARTRRALEEARAVLLLAAPPRPPPVSSQRRGRQLPHAAYKGERWPQPTVSLPLLSPPRQRTHWEGI